MTNLALNRPAQQSSTSKWSTDPLPEVDARVANNGDSDSDRWFHTETEFNPWWQVDLQDLYLIERVVIFNRQFANDRLRLFTVLRSTNGRDWFEAYEKTDERGFNEFTAEIMGLALARYVRIRLDGYDCLHFRECQVFGRPADPEECARLQAQDERALLMRSAPPPGRRGNFSRIGGFEIFVDEERYGPDVKKALRGGSYEGSERNLARKFLRKTDRVLEVGTAVGVVSMTAAMIVGAENVLTFDANPDIVSDARFNFERNGLGQIKSRVGVLVSRQNFRRDAFADFQISREFWASRLGAVDGAPNIEKTVKVPIFCLEDQISSHDANALICDIEGGEIDLLTGADLSRIRVIIIETHYWAVGETATDALVRELILQGFSLHLGESGNNVSVLRKSSS